MLIDKHSCKNNNHYPIQPTKSSVPASSKTAVLSAQNLTSTERAQALTERMKTTLNLTAAQTSEVSKINLDYASRIDKVMNSDQSTLDKKTEFKRLSAVKRIEIKDLLTEPQKQLYDAHKKELLDTY